MTIDENSTLVEVLQDVGDAVREKGVSGEWKGYQLPGAVREIRNDPVYDSRVTIQVNGVANGSFTVNQTSDSTINLQTLTMEQVTAAMPSKTSDLTNDSGFITESAVAASYATKSEVETVSASVSDLSSQVGQIDGQVSSLTSSMSEVTSTIPLKRDFFDLVYPNFDDDINDGFGMRFAYSFEGGMGSILTFNGTEYINDQNCATWGWHGQILVAMPNQSTIWLFDKYDNLKHTISLNEFKKTTQWLDYVSPAQDDMVIDALEVPRVVYLYLQTALDGRDRNTKIVLENQLSAYATASALESVSANVSTLTSSVTALGSSVSAMASSIADKRDYLDLTYNTTVPAETIDNSKLVWDDQDPLYNAKLTFTVNDSVEGEQHLAYDELDGIGMWIDRNIDEGSHQLFFVQYAEDWGSDPADGKFVLIDSSDVCYQFDLQDGVNVQTFNYTSEMLESTGTITMTFTGAPSYVSKNIIALTYGHGGVEELAGNVGYLSNRVTSLSSQVNANTSAISANASAIASNASAISAMASSISAVAGSLTVSGIGCSTVLFSGTYSDSTSFAFNVVVQPSASV